jgi:hypothetical protein
MSDSDSSDDVKPIKKVKRDPDASDDSDADEVAVPAKKKKRQNKKQTNDSGETCWDLGPGTKRCTVRTFKNNVYVDIREVRCVVSLVLVMMTELDVALGLAMLDGSFLCSSNILYILLFTQTIFPAFHLAHHPTVHTQIYLDNN